MSIRDLLAVRSPEFEADYPHALDLESRVLEAARPELGGAMAMLRGTKSEDDFRKIMRGVLRPGLDLKNFCRLRLSQRPEAQRATDAMLSVLLNAGRSGGAVSLDGVMKMLEETAGCVAGLARDLNDGVITREEASARLPQARILQARICALVTSLEVAERMGSK